MVVSFVATDTNTGDGAGTLVISNVTVAGETDPVLVCGISTRETSVNQVTGVDWSAAGGNEAFTKLTNAINGNAEATIFYLAGPSDATNGSVVITFAETPRCTGGVSLYAGVDQNNPFRSAVTVSGNGATGSPTVNVVPISGEFIVDTMCQVSAGPDTMLARFNERWNLASLGGGTDTRGCSQDEAIQSGATYTMDWRASSDDNWSIVAGALQIPQVEEGHPMFNIASNFFKF